jgi:hypothetical protein
MNHLPPFNRTLQLSLPFGQTLALAALVLLVIAGAAEFVFRLPAVESRLPAPSIGSDHDQLEVQVYRLHQFAAAGPVDCIFLGSSMVLRGINPAVFTDSYAAKTGESLRCFTFGLSGLTASAAGLLADYLVHTYHPRLLIYGVSPRDFNKAVVMQGFSGDQIANLDWMRYQRGAFNLTGWFFDHSRAFQYTYFYRDWLLPGFAARLESRRRAESEISPDGYAPSTRVLTWPISTAEKNHVVRLYRDYEPLPEELAGLQQIVGLHQSGQTRLVIVEVPFYLDIVTQLLGVDTYERFNRRVESYTIPAGVLYWPTTLLDLIPDEGWNNLNHLNTTGAEIFSRWLGEQIGAAVNSGELSPLAG